MADDRKHELFLLAIVGFVAIVAILIITGGIPSFSLQNVGAATYTPSLSGDPTLPGSSGQPSSQQQIGKKRCFDSDGGINTNVAGYITRVIDSSTSTLYDYCTSSSQVNEYYCTNDAPKSTVVACGSGTACSNGACVANQSNTSCTDADGDFYNINGGSCGTVDCNDNNANIKPGAAELCNSIDDDCDGLIDENCPSCFDTDGGIMPLIAGIVYFNTTNTTNSTGAFDTCMGNQVKEWYCSGTTAANTIINCTSVNATTCSALPGRCV